MTCRAFESKIRSGIELQVQQTARLDFSLELGSVEVAVEVTGGAPMINTTDATVGTVIKNEQIVELPLNGRNFIQPGVAKPERELRTTHWRRGRRRQRPAGWRPIHQNFSFTGERREYNNTRSTAWSIRM